MINRKSILATMCLMGIMGIFLCPSISLAAKTAADSVFSTAYDTMYATFKNARSVVYIFSGFGLIGVSVGAIMGKLNFSWLASICVALALLAGADQFVNYFINPEENIIPDKSYRGIGEDDFVLDVDGLQFSD